MKTHRWWIMLLMTVAGCGPVNYWAGSYTSELFDAFPFLKPAGAGYKYPPGYDPKPPVPRSGPVPKKPRPVEPLPGADDATPDATTPNAATPSATTPNS
jgi:hypothetical protein